MLLNYHIVVLFSVRCVLEICYGWFRVVSVLQVRCVLEIWYGWV